MKNYVLKFQFMCSFYMLLLIELNIDGLFVGGDFLSNVKLVERDYHIFQTISKWRVISGKHICKLCDFSSQSACDRRLRKLIDNGYVTRRKILYGIPNIYYLTDISKKMIGIKLQSEQIRVEQIVHDLTVLDTAIYFNSKFNISFSSMITEKQLHSKDGFGIRRHRPDFVFERNQKKYCVEVELNLKSRERFLKNIVSNFTDYDGQFWIVPDINSKIAGFLEKQKNNYPNIKLIELSEVKNYEL